MLSFALIGATACGWNTTEPSLAVFEDPPSDGLPTICSVGATDPGAAEVPMAHVLREPGAYEGRTVRMRGYLVLQFEDGFYLHQGSQRLRLVLDEPIASEGQNLRPRESTACGELQVDVEGTLRIARAQIPGTIDVLVRSVRTAPRDKPAP